MATRSSISIGSLTAAVSLFAITAPVLAQTPKVAAASGTSEELAEVVVSGSRIDRSGFEAPTPTTVVNAESLEQRAIVNIGEALMDIPSFRAAAVPNAGGLANPGGFLADLRGLGPTRTLVLLDKSRLPQTVAPSAGGAGTTDLNIIPTALIRSADVVTGGASAAYGSDAVAGVVNLVLNDRLTGLRATAQFGETEYHDAKESFLSIAGGHAFFDDRLHVIAGGEYYNNNGTDYRDRPRDWQQDHWLNVTYPNRPAGVPNVVLAPDVFFGSATSGGLIRTAGPLFGLAFVPQGGTVTTVPFARGLVGIGNNFDVFSAAALAQNSANGINNEVAAQLLPSVERYNVLAKASFDFTDKVTGYIEPLYSHVTSDNIILTRRDGSGAGPPLNFARDNAYLQQYLTPAQYALVPASGLQIGYIGNDFGPNERNITKDVWRVQTGLKGSFGNSWKWDAAYVYAQSNSDVEIPNNFLNTNFRNALDAVVAGGQIVCRSAAARAAGCVPVNILGATNATPAARSYFLGTAYGTGYVDLNEVSANLQGEPFSTWAGPVSIGLGADYRTESLRITTDPLSQATAWLTSTGQPLDRVETQVKEAYVETIVPLLADKPFAESLNFNGAVRLTDYSTSGNVTPWKVGLTYTPGAGVTFRAVSSSDIRAPNLLELFTPTTPFLPLPVDPRPGVPPITNSAGVTTGGNANLDPEKSTTKTFGIVYRPTFTQGLQMSVDYYDIRIKDAIAQTPPPTVVNNCFPGGVYNGGPYCSLITFANNDPLHGQITAIQGTTANVAEFKTSGVDFAISYRQPLSALAQNLPGDLTINFQSTHVIEFSSSTDISAFFPDGVNRAGQTGAAFGGAAGLPDWNAILNANYEVGRFSTNVNLHFISASHQSNALIGPDQAGYDPTLANTVNDNTIPAFTYLDLGFTYYLGDDDKKSSVYFNVDNVFDKDPPQPAAGSAYYDLLGRSYKIGVRYAF